MPLLNPLTPPFCSKGAEELLIQMMGSKMALQETGKRATLAGLPLPLGTHVRFGEDGEVQNSPTSGKTLLRGLASPKGRHMRFN